MGTAFAINENNGFLIESSQAVLVSDIDAVAVNCQTEAQTLRGEDPFDQLKGMPNFQTVWDGNPNVLQFEFFLRRTLLAVENVIRVSDFQASISDSVLTYRITVHTTFGSVTITGTINA